MSYATLGDFELSAKTVLLRADLNVPVKDAQVTDTTRIERLKSTIEYLVENDAKVVILSHFGRPKGEKKSEFSLEFLPHTLEKSWGIDVAFTHDCIGETAQFAVENLQPGQVLLLENLRFYPGEEANDVAFARELAKLGDLFINDAFSAAHRAHASTEGLAHLLPTAPGFLMEAELSALEKALENPQKPVMAIVGGAKISTKLALLNNLVKKVDYLALGGGMANTFMHAKGIEVGKSLCEKDMAAEAKEIMKTAESFGCDILLPVDRVVLTTDTFGENAPHEILSADKMPADREGVDIGPETVAMLENILKDCRTVLWNGPMGVFELTPFDEGTNKLAQAVAELTHKNALVSVAGGGDTVAALENAGVTHQFRYISTAGGAFLEWLEGKTLPGVAALTAYQQKAA